MLSFLKGMIKRRLMPNMQKSSLSPRNGLPVWSQRRLTHLLTTFRFNAVHARAANIKVVNLRLLRMRRRIVFYDLRRLLKQRQEPSFVTGSALGRAVPMARQADSLPIRGGRRSRYRHITLHRQQGHPVVGSF